MPYERSAEAEANETAARAPAEERRLRRDLGFWGLTSIGFSNIVGSGRLFAAIHAPRTAGPAALLSWLAAGVLVGPIALVMRSAPESHTGPPHGNPAYNSAPSFN